MCRSDRLPVYGNGDSRNTPAECIHISGQTGRGVYAGVRFRYGVDAVSGATGSAPRRGTVVGAKAQDVQSGYPSRSNIPISRDQSLQCVASGIRCWGALCDLRGSPHFPAVEEAISGWSACFPAGETFQECPPHLVELSFCWDTISASEPKP